MTTRVEKPETKSKPCPETLDLKKGTIKDRIKLAFIWAVSGESEFLEELSSSNSNFFWVKNDGFDIDYAIAGHETEDLLTVFKLVASNAFAASERKKLQAKLACFAIGYASPRPVEFVGSENEDEFFNELGYSGYAQASGEIIYRKTQPATQARSNEKPDKPTAELSFEIPNSLAEKLGLKVIFKHFDEIEIHQDNERIRSVWDEAELEEFLAGYKAAIDHSNRENADFKAS